MRFKHSHSFEQTFPQLFRRRWISSSQIAVDSFQIANGRLRPDEGESYFFCHERKRRTTSSWETTSPRLEARSASRRAARVSTLSRTCRAEALFGNRLIASKTCSLNESVAFMARVVSRTPRLDHSACTNVNSDALDENFNVGFDEDGHVNICDCMNLGGLSQVK